MELKYRRNGHSYAYDLPGDWEAEDDLGEMAEAAAQDYWDNHDGFEARWPLTFDVLLPDGGLIGSATVEMDTEPVFTAKPHNAIGQGSAACGASPAPEGYTSGTTEKE